MIWSQSSKIVSICATLNKNINIFMSWQERVIRQKIAHHNIYNESDHQKRDVKICLQKVLKTVNKFPSVFSCWDPAEILWNKAATLKGGGADFSRENLHQ